MSTTENESAVSIRNLSKTFDGNVKALDDVSLEIPKESFVGLLGPNGAGKTTLIGLLGGLVRPTAGSASVMGHDVVASSTESRRAIGIVPQELVFDPFFTTREWMLQQSTYYGLYENHKWVDELLEKLGLTDKAHETSRALSGGMKRRLMVGMALVHKPPVVILDEPTAGVDVSQRRSLWEFINSLNDDGTTVILTTHYLEEAEDHCERIVMLDEGKVIADKTTQELLGSKWHQSRCVLFKLVDNAALPSQLSSMPITGPDEEGQYSLAFDEYPEIENLISVITQANARIANMEITTPDLEDVFLQLTESKQK